ncbi:hypothetical protein QBC38DRAFT_54424 [Podospora fimiseda]|uniref:Uncharacterized protein n=1 Tax=Podospora fimiseda TaxID=252190 RepID=A0AAN7BH15_9PEZI|nr:hypothetical protein QBC38DRAFT_54424 [Podospora fimiseda]
MFTNFSHPVLQRLFTPSLSASLDDTTHYKQTLTYGITFLVLPFALTALYSPLAWCFQRLWVSRRNPAVKTTKDWRPSVFSSTYLVFLTLLTLFFIVLVAVMSHWSQLPDTFSERK